MTAPPAPAAARRPRDPRLDFYRGAGMFIILIAHIPYNPWLELIPARFGFSDATEVFVFCSGMASALAFGGVFGTHGWGIGTARILYRMWQVYWANMATFLVFAGVILWADAGTGGHHYATEVNLAGFVADPARGLLGLLTLTYLPAYFDILPMYIVVLGLIPGVMALASIGRWAVAAALGALWLLAALGGLDLPADPWSDRPWLFNPFSWQLVFFTGFAFGRGWIPAPPIERRRVRLALLLVVVTVPFAWHQLFPLVPILGEAHAWLAPLIDKTHLGILRYLHFLAVAYLAYAAAGEGGRRLHGPAVEIVRRVGQQSLAVFLTGIVAAQLLGLMVDRIGAGPVAYALANLLGAATLIGAALVAGWYRSPPWTRRPTPAPAAAEPSGDLARERR